MPADPKDLERRLAAATDADTSRGLNFNTLFHLVRDELGPAVPKEIDPAGKGSRIDFFSYPVADYLRIAWIAVDRLEGKLGGVDGVWRELGRRTVESFLASAIGRTIFAIAGRDPRKVVSAGPAGYRTAVSYGERSVAWLGERHARMTFKRDFVAPVFHAAVIQTALESTDAVNPRVTPRELALLDSEYDIVWE